MPFLDRSTGGDLAARADQARRARSAALYGRNLTGMGLEIGADTFRRSDAALVDAADEAGQRSCAVRNCTGWIKPWKNRRRPIFEAGWGCSDRCLETLVHGAVRREFGEGSTYLPAEPHRHRVPLGLVLLTQGWITQKQLQEALEAQRLHGHGRIGHWLIKVCGVPQERITRGLCAQWNCPALTLDGFSAAAMAFAMPKRLIAECGLLPVRTAGSTLLYLASEDRMDAAVSLAMEQMSGLRVECGLLPDAQFAATRTALLEAEGIPATTHTVRSADTLTASLVKVIEQRQPLASKLVRVHQYYWLRLWLESAALQGVGTLPRSSEDVEDHLFTIAM